ASFPAGLSRDLAWAPGVFADPEDDELARLHRRYSDLDHDLAGLDHVRRVRLLVALDEERHGGRTSEQCALAPRAREEVRRRHPELRPEPLVVRLENSPLRPLHDRLGYVVEETADVQITPLGVARERPCAPQADPAAGE